MDYMDNALRDYVAGDRMGELEESLRDGVRLDCSRESYPAAGPVLWSDGKEMVVDAGEAHTLIVSSTGGGKTVSQVMPMLLGSIKAGESLLVTDVKAGELYEAAYPYLRQQDYRTFVINLRHPLKGGRYNPLDLPYRLLQSDKVEHQALGHQLMAQVADALMMHTVNERDMFWDMAARDTFLGILYLLCARKAPEHIHLAGAHDVFTMLQSHPKQMASMLKNGEGELLGAARRMLQTRLFSNDSPRTASSIDSMLAGKFNQFLRTPLQADLLSGNDLDFASLDQARIAIFLLLPDESDLWEAHASLLVMQVYQYLCLLSGDHPRGRLPHRFHFLLEEFGNLSLGQGASSLFSAGRSRNIRVTAVIQNFSQLDHRYGKETADTIRYNCGNWIYLHSRDIQTLELLSSLCGTRTFLREGMTQSVASVGDLQRIPVGQALIFQPRKRPYLTHLAPVWEYPETAMPAPARYPNRVLREHKTLTMSELFAGMISGELRQL